MNLLKMLQDQMGGELMEKAGSFLGESTETTSSAMGAALPSILGSLISKGSSQSGASGILDMVTKGGFDGGMLSNIGSMFGGGDATSGLIKSGGGILSSLMGNKLGGLTDMIASMSGMKKSSSSSLLSMAAPIVMNMLGKKILGDKMGAGGLMKFLGSQAGFVSKALPSGISDLMGFGNLGGGISDKVGAAAKSVGNTASNAADEVKSSGGGILKWLLIGALALLALGYFGFKTGCDTVDNAATTMSEGAGDLAEGAKDMASDAAGAAADMAGDAAGAVGDAAGAVADGAANLANKALEGITFAAGSVGAKMSEMFAAGGDLVGKTVAFKNMSFKTGSADISAESMSELENFAKVLNAYKDYHIEVGGHTDKSGDAQMNQKLSEARAGAVKAALVKLGVATERISAKGYGQAADEKKVEIKITK